MVTDMEKLARLTIRVPTELHKQLKLVAVGRGETMQVCATKALRRFIDSNKQGEKRG